MTIEAKGKKFARKAASPGLHTGSKQEQKRRSKGARKSWAVALIAAATLLFGLFGQPSPATAANPGLKPNTPQFTVKDLGSYNSIIWDSHWTHKGVNVYRNGKFIGSVNAPDQVFNDFGPYDNASYVLIGYSHRNVTSTPTKAKKPTTLQSAVHNRYNDSQLRSRQVVHPGQSVPVKTDLSPARKFNGTMTVNDNGINFSGTVETANGTRVGTLDQTSTTNRDGTISLVTNLSADHDPHGNKLINTQPADPTIVGSNSWNLDAPEWEVFSHKSPKLSSTAGSDHPQTRRGQV